MDRKKDVIQRAGENIAAAEVERVLSEHPGIDEAAVIAVPDPIRDEAVMAIIRPMPGVQLEEDEVREFCKKRMAKFKVPQFYVFQQDDFPKTSIGKIRKNIIRDDVMENWDKT
jgi:crotonobetaine/carnitine-CoA ligase